MDYTLHQRGRASIEFLVDLGIAARGLEARGDRFAAESGLVTDALPTDVDASHLNALHDRVTPIMQTCLDFRLFRMLREWQLDQHGWIGREAFDEIRAAVEGRLRALDAGATTLDYAAEPPRPAYWADFEFHRTAGGWDGHDFMGFVHGEILHRKVLGGTLADAIMQQRADAARIAYTHWADIDLSDTGAPKKILELGCGSGQYTFGLAAAYPQAELWACDLSARQLEECRRRANEHGLHWHLLQAAAEDTGLDADTFDFVTSYAVFHELPAHAAQEVLAESLRVLKPGGTTLVADVKAYRAQDDYQCWKADFLNQVHGGDPFWRDYATTDLAAVARDVGFADAQWFGVGEAQYPFVLIARKPDATETHDD
jgi:SAM-dependent methyltransferase